MEFYLATMSHNADIQLRLKSQKGGQLTTAWDIFEIVVVGLFTLGNQLHTHNTHPTINYLRR